MDKLSPEHRGWLMSRVRSTNAIPEMVVRRLVFGMGYRYRLHDKQLPGKPDKPPQGAFCEGLFLARARRLSLCPATENTSELLAHQDKA